MSKRKLVVVEWVDSHSQSGGGWSPLDEIETTAEPVHCLSVGWVVAENAGILVIASHISGERNANTRLYGKGDIAIPKRCITKVSKLMGAVAAAAKGAP